MCPCPEARTRAPSSHSVPHGRLDLGKSPNLKDQTYEMNIIIPMPGLLALLGGPDETVHVKISRKRPSLSRRDGKNNVFPAIVISLAIRTPVAFLYPSGAYGIAWSLSLWELSDHLKEEFILGTQMIKRTSSKCAPEVGK